jgi:hypothetical protein
MQHFLRERPEIARVFNFITLQLGNDVLVSVKLQMAGVTTANELVSAINAVESDFKQRYPQVRWSFFEPDDKD